MTIFVVVDGNNLEHEIFNLRGGAHVSPDIDLLFAQALEKWALQQNQSIVIELCLDPRNQPISGNKIVEVFVADHGSEADEVIRHRVRFHVYNREPCIVITSDEHIRDDVQEYKVPCLTNHEFVRLKHRINPVFYPLPGEIPIGTLAEPFREGDQSSRTNLRREKPIEVSQKYKSKEEHDQALLRTMSLFDPGKTSNFNSQEGENPGTFNPHGAPTIQADSAQGVSLEQKTISIHLTIPNWPARGGAKFLRESFCRKHFQAYQTLIDETEDESSDYLATLASILLETCGGESDFVRRGGSLMDRIRLALLQAENMRLNLEQLVERTGDSQSRIKHKLKDYEGLWLETRKI